ncbi:outer membrane protein assembly factor BamB family protein, partial [Nonomuraea sp. NPDC004297]
MHRRSRLVPAGGILALLATACSADPDTLVTAPSPPVVTIVPGTPSASPTAPPVTTPDWSIELTGDGQDRWSRAQLLAAGDRFLLSTGSQVRGITDQGKEAWKRTFPSPVSVAVADGVVIATYRQSGKHAWPPPKTVLGIDPANGKTRWKATTSPYESVVGDMVYTPVCRGEQTERPDDCRLSARDPHTGQARWTVPAEHVATVTGSAGDVLTMTTRPKGYRGKHWLMTLDAGSGRRLGVRVEKERFGGELLFPAGQDRVSGPTFLSSGVLVMSSEKQQVKTFKEKCRLDLAALNTRTGAKKWTARVRLGDPEGEYGCRSALPDVSDDGRGLFGVDESGNPLVLDLVTGRVRWTGRTPGTILAGDGETALVKEKGTLTLYDLSSG